VKLGRDDGVLNKKLEGNDLERVFVRGFEEDGAGRSSLLNLQPAGGADTPAVAGFQAGEAKLRHGGAQIVAEGLRRFEERSIDDAADCVDTKIVRTSLTAAGAVEAGHWLAAADVQGLAEDVLATILDGFRCWHRFYCNSDRIDRGLCRCTRIKRWIKNG
jgi:hypothetical protein